jgi:hypothetical protein
MEPQIHLFGGQGWSGLFLDQPVAVAKHDVTTSQYAEELLNRCHKSLIKDVSLLYSQGDEDAAQFLSVFTSPSSLLCPPKQLQTHPCIQGTTLCLFQLLRFIAETPSVSAYEDLYNRIYGATGFCSGILPAVVVASSPTIEDFVENGLHAFRAAFWIGYRTAEYSRCLLRQTAASNGPWAYNLSGVSQSRISDLISHFNSDVQVR